jgi:hypothetical protein
MMLYISYRENDGRFHWFLHFFVGASVALLAMAVFTFVSGRRVLFVPVWLFIGHLIAMIPDVLWQLLIAAHEPWMDVFLGHISAHFMPGRNWTWYVVFLLCLALYLYAVATRETPKDTRCATAERE